MKYGFTRLVFLFQDLQEYPAKYPYGFSMSKINRLAGRHKIDRVDPLAKNSSAKHSGT